MPYTFAKFTWIQTENEQIIRQGEMVYYTSAEQNIDEMKKQVRNHLHDGSAVISLPLISPITQEQFERFTGKPFQP